MRYVLPRDAASPVNLRYVARYDHESASPDVLFGDDNAWVGETEDNDDGFPTRYSCLVPHAVRKFLESRVFPTWFTVFLKSRVVEMLVTMASAYGFWAYGCWQFGRPAAIDMEGVPMIQ